MRAAIDHVYTLAKIEQLVEHARSARNPPESRFWPSPGCRALWEMAQEARQPRPNVDMAYVEALAAGCSSQTGAPRGNSAHCWTFMTSTRSRARSRWTISICRERARQAQLHCRATISTTG